MAVGPAHKRLSALDKNLATNFCFLRTVFCLAAENAERHVFTLVFSPLPTTPSPCFPAEPCTVPCNISVSLNCCLLVRSGAKARSEVVSEAAELSSQSVACIPGLPGCSFHLLTACKPHKRRFGGAARQKIHALCES